jgi:hypothetical protein
MQPDFLAFFPLAKGAQRDYLQKLVTVEYIGTLYGLRECIEGQHNAVAKVWEGGGGWSH